MSQPRSAPVSPRGRSFSPEFSQTYDFDGYAVRGLSHVLRAAEQQRKSQLKRLQHLKLAAERAAYQQQQAEMQQALEARKQELIQLDRKCKEESLAMSKAEAESKRQQTLRNSVVLYEDKRRQAEQKVVRVEQQAAKHNYVKEREAAIRRECASDRERYRQQVLSRNALIEEQKRQQAAMKGAEMEQQLRKRAKEQEVEERLKAEEHQRNERHRQWVLERAEMEAELKREQRLRAQAEKEYVVKRNQAEMEMELAARKQAMRRLDEERKAKAAHAAHLEELQKQYAGKRYAEKAARVEQIEHERQQVLGTMGRLRQEMSLQEEVFRQTLEQMKVRNTYNSRNLLDFSRSMTDVSRYLSPGSPSSSFSPTVGRRSTPPSTRPQSAPLRRNVNPGSSQSDRRSPTAAVHRNAAPLKGSPSPRARSVPRTPKSAPKARQRRPSPSRTGGASSRVPSVSPRGKLNFAAGRGAGGEREGARYSPDGVGESGDIPEEVGMGTGPSTLPSDAGNVQSSSGRGGTVPSSTSSPASRKLSERQLELKLLIEREQGKEQARQALLRQVVDPAEKRRLIKIFTAEREKAKESILSLSFAGSNSGASNDEEVGLRKERK